MHMCDDAIKVSSLPRCPIDGERATNWDDLMMPTPGNPPLTL